jgi:AcrR family transcriptional regulator
MAIQGTPQARPWGGSPPGGEDQARLRILAAATDCLEQKGLAKTFLSDVARRAGITRPTLYRYFPTKENLVMAALREESVQFTLQHHQAMAKADTAAERYVEGMYYSLTRLPNTRVLKFMVQPEYVDFVARDDPGLGLTIQAIEQGLEPVFEPRPELRFRSAAIAEITWRWIISLLQFQVGAPRRGDALKQYIRDYVLPSTGLNQ